MEPTPRLRDARLEADLERDGYAMVDGLLDAGDVERLADFFARHDVAINQRAFAASIMSDDLAYRGAVDREIKAVLAPRIAAVFASYRHCFSNFATKAPVVGDQPDEGAVALHQDIAFVDESRFQSLAIWAPLVDTTEANGCLWVIPGSHRWNGGPRGPGTPFPYAELRPHLDARLQAVPMKAGSAMIFCQKLFHASAPNRGSTTRVAVGALLAPTGAPLRCYYRDPAAPGRFDVYEVDDLFYTQYTYRSRPEGVPHVGTIDYRHDDIEGPLGISRAARPTRLDRLRRLFGAGGRRAGR